MKHRTGNGRKGDREAGGALRDRNSEKQTSSPCSWIRVFACCFRTSSARSSSSCLMTDMSLTSTELRLPSLASVAPRPRRPSSSLSSPRAAAAPSPRSCADARARHRSFVTTMMTVSVRTKAATTPTNSASSGEAPVLGPPEPESVEGSGNFYIGILIVMK